MNIIMHFARTPTVTEMEAFLNGSSLVQFEVPSANESYQWIHGVLRHNHYSKLKKKEKGTVRRYIGKLTGYGRSQVARLIHQFVEAGRIHKIEYKRHRFPSKYSSEDLLLLAETDKAHEVLSGPATLAIFKREVERFGKKEYGQLADLSVSHLYNLRKRSGYREIVKHYEKTKPERVPLGERIKPRPKGRPGYLRVDTVHQGDREGEKGVYYINMVDEVTQWEITVCVEKISEQYLVPALAAALSEFPFEILNFHADNGSEYINKFVAELLNKMQVKLTKSRPRCSGDNGLVECKNGAIIRKALGYAHIPQENAERINGWCKTYLNPYLNFHRPCGFPVEKTDRRGKVKRIYPKDKYQIPYEKLKAIEEAEKYLKEGITFARLDAVAYSVSDTEFARLLQKQKALLFLSITFPTPFQAHS